jgi:putative membrane protein
MRIFSFLCVLIVLAPLLSFALSNVEPVAVSMWPFAGAAPMPAYLLALAPLAFGLLLGGLWGWAASVPHRLRARRLTKENSKLNDRISDMQKSSPSGLSSPVLPYAVSTAEPRTKPRRPFWKRS